MGRDGELEALRDAARDVSSRGASAALITGDGGSGKSRLVEELVNTLRSDGFVVAAGASTAFDFASVPYAPLAGVLRDLIRAGNGRLLHDVPPAAVRELAFLAPSAFVAVDVGDSVPTKASLFDALLSALAIAASEIPLALVIEDLHWADSATVAALDFLIRNLTDESIFVLGTLRPDEVAVGDARRSVLMELSRHDRVRTMALAPLAPSDVALMATAIIRREPPPDVVAELHERSGGLPLFVEELLAAGDDLPAGLQQLVLARSEGLSKPATVVLRAASVAGAVVEHDLLGCMCGQDEDELDAAVAELIEARLLRVEPRTSRYVFRHALLREAVYDDLRPGERRRLHRRAADTIGCSTPAALGMTDEQQTAALAHHWWHANEWERSVPPLLAAAATAESLLANAEAHAHLERALEAWSRIPDAEARVGVSDLAILERACEAAQWAERGVRAVELATLGVARARACGDGRTVASWLARYGRAVFNEGDATSALQAFDEAADLLPADAPSRERARVVAEAARVLMMMSRYTDAQLRATEALELARSVGGRLEEVHALVTFGCCRFGLGFIDEGIDHVRRGLDLARELGNPEALHRAFGNLAGMTLNAGRLEESVAVVQEGLRLTRDVDGAWMGTAATNAARALVRLGRWEDAQTLVEEFPGGTLRTSGCAHQSLAAVSIRRGDFAEATVSLAIADERSAGLQDVIVRGWYHTVAAELALEEGRPLDAWNHIEAGLALQAATEDDSVGPEMRALGIRALIDSLALARGRGAKPDVEPEKVRLLCGELADAAAVEVVAPVSRGGTVQPEAAAFADQCQAEVSRLERSDPELWRATAQRWYALGQPYHRAYCQWREAEALLDSRRDRRRAVEVLSTARQICVDLGAVPLLQQVTRLAQRAGVELSDVDRPAEDREAAVARDLGITRRELEVLRCLARGRSDRQIAEELFISKKTASVHVSNLLRKLAVGSRIEAGEVGQRAGLG
ncbi:MAG TPA: AAA family ATPase [Acidimicrobiales bacterium]|nr:AAA family ATPase [Acidimicrobiales bacterium]